MRISDYLLSTLKENPKDAEIVSHQLMLRAGMVRKLASGIYTWMPLGLRVLRKLENIVREEMDRIGGLEILMPAIQPSELWIESGRWDQYGRNLLKLKDRHNNDFCFGPTHEEVLTDLMRKEIQSYKQLPKLFYQIATKFRDEIRPRFGVMRSREFVMKDAYSIHLDQASLEKTYQSIHGAYCKIFDRLGLNYRSVLADSGSIGGALSHEFQVLADTGEDQVFYSDRGEYAANIEFAEAIPDIAERPAPTGNMETVDTPEQDTIAAVSAFLKVDPKQTVKTLIVKGSNDDLIALILRGDHELNLLKAEKHPAIHSPLTFASDDEIVNAIGALPGSLGPVNLKMTIIADRSANVLSDFVCGANKNGKHFINVNWDRDLPNPEIFDLRNVQVGDLTPDGKGKYLSCRGIEVGHIFQLGDKYSQSMQAEALNENGKPVKFIMGCYGLGVTRIVAAAIEQNHDENGIIWPESIAPFQLALIPINLKKSKRLQMACESLYEKFLNAGFDTIFDDRNERPGVMFANADLIGIPHRLVLSEKGLDAGTIEYKKRTDKDSQNIPIDSILEFLSKTLATK